MSTPEEFRTKLVPGSQGIRGRSRSDPALHDGFEHHAFFLPCRRVLAPVALPALKRNSAEVDKEFSTHGIIFSFTSGLPLPDFLAPSLTSWLRIGLLFRRKSPWRRVMSKNPFRPRTWIRPQGPLNSFPILTGFANEKPNPTDRHYLGKYRSRIIPGIPLVAHGNLRDPYGTGSYIDPFADFPVGETVGVETRAAITTRRVAYVTWCRITHAAHQPYCHGAGRISVPGPMGAANEQAKILHACAAPISEDSSTRTPCAQYARAPKYAAHHVSGLPNEPGVPP